ncbi:hypothetical protein CXF96_05405 [Stenotrophomonas sp. Betaine-02u-21]|uniref:hypothetical protein n=1 Tax=unclassified Stenotrophomonas TaxID=196198 RepID=UPI000C34A77D|nr:MULTISPECIES: hypothetical protein [unclassified Stenotrophomonas]PKH70281.1 hypothetical protein CXF90_15410 [Stenotrophomonas sp. Betaine-02u-23]PKH75174.1 hypothetical protein CXF96_05405 [Stenotrophomonas sp. Betaine-02u-21]PKH97597.1 hypothetical protein CXG43_01835 [Stenotrophomonas sp. Bg11-02]
MASFALAPQGTVRLTVEARPRAGAVCIRFEEAFLHASPEEAAVLMLDLERALMQLKLAGSTAPQYTTALSQQVAA